MLSSLIGNIVNMDDSTRKQLLSMGQGLLKASGTTRLPVSTGQAIAMGMDQVQANEDRDFDRNDALMKQAYQRAALGLKMQQANRDPIMKKYPHLRLNEETGQYEPRMDVVQGMSLPDLYKAQAMNPINAEGAGMKAAATHPYKVRESAAGATNVNVNTEGFDDPFRKKAAENFARRYDAAVNAVNSANALDEMERLIESGMITGTGANLLTGIGGALMQAGIIESTSDAGRVISNTQAYIGNAAKEVAQIIKDFGAGTGLSDKDREFATRAAAGDIEFTRDALLRLIDINRRAKRNIAQNFNTEMERMPMDEGLKESFRVPVPQAAPQPPSGGLAMPQSKAEYDALPSGTVFQAPDGTIRTKP